MQKLLSQEDEYGRFMADYGIRFRVPCKFVTFNPIDFKIKKAIVHPSFQKIVTLS